MTPEQQTSELAQAIQEVSEKASLLVREEIELAKAEVSKKAKSLLGAAVAGGVAVVFALAALIYFLHFVAWGLTSLLGSGAWLGYLIVSLLLVVGGALAAFFAARMVRKGVPPTPQMAIEEGKLIRETIRSSEGHAP
jgi:uncharacterized membrane protein YqjE